MSNYQQVQDALSQGVSPADLCRTCPWDRLCISPPEMTRDQIEREQAKQCKESEAQMKEDPKGGMGAVVGTLLTSILYAGKDTAAQVCPVLVVRMRSSEGRAIADSVRAQMKAWDDSVVSTGA